MNEQRGRNALWFMTVVLVLLMLTGCAGSATSSMGAPAADSAPVMQERALAQAGETDGSSTIRQVIANASLELVVADAQSAMDEISTLAGNFDGYITDANLYRTNYSGEEQLQGVVTLRVPAARLEQALGALEALAVKTNSKSINRQDVTEQYSDLDAQLRNLQATENELRAMLEEVRSRPEAKPADILEVYRELATIRGQIEQVQGKKNVLDNQIALSTISVTLTPDVALRPVVQEGWRPGVVVRDATRTLISALQGIANLAIWFVIVLAPVLLILIVPIVILVLLLRWLIRRRRKPGATPTGSQ